MLYSCMLYVALYEAVYDFTIHSVYLGNVWEVIKMLKCWLLGLLICNKCLLDITIFSVEWIVDCHENKNCFELVSLFYILCYNTQMLLQFRVLYFVLGVKTTGRNRVTGFCNSKDFRDCQKTIEIVYRFSWIQRLKTLRYSRVCCISGAIRDLLHVSYKDLL